METISGLIEMLGGNATVASKLGLRASGVSEMKRRGSIPTRHWCRLIELAAERGLDLSAARLMALHSEKSEAAE